MMVEYYYCVEHTTAARSVVSLLILGALHPIAFALSAGESGCLGHESYYVPLLKNPNIW